MSKGSRDRALNLNGCVDHSQDPEQTLRFPGRPDETVASACSGSANAPACGSPGCELDRRPDPSPRSRSRSARLLPSGRLLTLRPGGKAPRPSSVTSARLFAMRTKGKHDVSPIPRGAPPPASRIFSAGGRFATGAERVQYQGGHVGRLLAPRRKADARTRGSSPLVDSSSCDQESSCPSAKRRVD